MNVFEQWATLLLFLSISDHQGLQTQAVLKIANDSETHWRYAIVAVRALRALLRRDVPNSPSHVRLFLEKACDSDPSMVRYCVLLGCRNSLKLLVTISAM